MDYSPSSDFATEPWIQLIVKIEVVRLVVVHPEYQMDYSTAAKASLVYDLWSVQQSRSLVIVVEK
jgi:hypothetical protein